MQSSTLRAGRSRRALARAVTAALTVLIGITACADDPVGPTPRSTAAPSVQPLGAPIQLTVTNASGGTEVGSIRWAASQIVIPDGGVIRFDPSLDGDTITLDAGLFFEHRVWIEGPPNGITLSGNDQYRVILGADAVSLKNVTVTNGNATRGSAVWSAGTIVLQHSTVHGNRGSGAAVDGQGYSLHILNSTISGNVVGTAAVEYTNGAQVTITSSTIAHNGPGAGLRMDGVSNPWELILYLNNSIISNNAGGNCTSIAGFVFEGTNISNDSSCGAVRVIVADPMLLPLADNGGPGMTHAIPPQSPAYNPAGGCNVDVDQRYIPRDGKCDTGAFEFNDPTHVTITIDPTTKLDATGNALLTGTIRCTRADAFRLALELHQDQKIGRESVDIHSASDIPVQCTTTARPWSATMALIPGEAFQAGAARATAVTLQTPEWVTPANVASGVKISFSRR